jgi:hypothetical protein
MDEAIFFGGVVLCVLFGPWFFLWLGRRRRKRERAEDQDRWRDLTNRVYRLELKLEALQAAGRDGAPSPAEAKQVPTENSQKPVAAEAPAVPPVRPPEGTPAGPSRMAEAWVRKQPLEPAAPPELAPPPPPRPAYPPPPSFAELRSGTSGLGRFKSALDVEETLGANWLNKLGITILVLGIASFLAYQIKALGPAGKVLVGYMVSTVLLASGVWLERKERYRILARAEIGGGWALLFFTAYAMYHVPAARVLESQLIDLVVMLGVASAMVWHTLRFASQVVTGLAFLLALFTVTISHVSVYSLSAGLVLAGAMVVIVVRMQWFELEVFGMMASYLNHYLWLRPIIEPMQGHHRMFPEFAASAGILLLYWAVFRASYLVRRPKADQGERISTFSALLNTALLMALLKYQSVHPEWAFWALVAIGAADLALAQLPVTRRRRNAVIVLATLGVILLIAALPFRYSGTRLSVLWVLEAEALLLVGVWTREIVFRRLGLLAMLLVSGQMTSSDAAQVLGKRMDGADLSRDFRAALMFAVAAVVFYADAHWVFGRWGNLFAHEFDRRLIQRLSYVAAFLALTAAWIAFPEAWTAAAWGVLALALMAAGQRWNIRELGYQSAALALLAWLRALAVNLSAEEKYHGFTLRLLTVSLLAGVLYVGSRWKVQDDGQGLTVGGSLYSFSRLVSGGYTWAASFLLALLAWYELRPVGVADAWVMSGLALLTLGLRRQSVALRLQAYVLFLAGFLRIFFVNLNAAGGPGEISPRFYTVVPLALAFFYAYWRLRQSGQHLRDIDCTIRSAGICCYLGTITVASLMRFELPADWVAAAWSGLTFALLALAWRSQHRIFLHQGLWLAFAVLFRVVLHNFYQRSYFPPPGWESRWVTVGAAIALLFASLLTALQLRRKDPRIESGMVRLLQALAWHPEQPFFFITVALLTVLLSLEMRHGMVTVSWGVEAVAVFLFALWVNQRSFRLTGLGLLLLSVGKILLVDVWGLNPRDRYLTLIVLGAALLLVSFLYTRHREAIRQYL